MGFLNGILWIAASAALIPLALHLFFRRRVKVVEFSSLRYLKEMEKHQLRRLKIRQWLLLILRMLIVIVVVAAFARPTARDGAIGSHASVSAVVLIDNSASMGRTVADGSLLELGRTRTRQLLEVFSQSDEVALINLSRSGSASNETMASAAVALQKLDRLQRSGSAADLQYGLQAATDLLGRAKSLNRELYVVSDRQRSSLPEKDFLAEADIPVYLLDLPLEEVDNLGIVAVDFGGQLIQPGHDFDVVATINNYGRRPSDQRLASLHLDGRRVAQVDFSVAPGTESTVRFTRSVSSTGFHSGYIEISDDHFAADNRFYFSFRIPDQSNLLIIDGDPAARLVALALQPNDEISQYWSVKTAQLDELSQVNFLDYEVVVLAGLPQLNDTQLRRLQSFLRRGGGLFAFYGSGTDIEHFNSAWSDITGVRYQQAMRTNFTRAGYYTVTEFALDHPIFQPFGFDQTAPPDLKFFSLPKVEALATARTLMTFSGGQPALVETTYSEGRVLTFTGSIAPAHGDLASHGFFVPFISRVIEYLASDLTSLETRLYAGQNITRAVPPTGSTVYEVEVIRPDGQTFRVIPQDDDGALVVRLGAIELEGIYRLMSAGREIDRLAVNVQPSECDLAAVDADQFITSLGASEHRLLEFDQPLAAAIADFRVGRELWQLVLWLAVLLLAAEMLLGRRSTQE